MRIPNEIIEELRFIFTSPEMYLDRAEGSLINYFECSRERERFDPLSFLGMDPSDEKELLEFIKTEMKYYNILMKKIVDSNHVEIYDDVIVIGFPPRINHAMYEFDRQHGEAIKTFVNTYNLERYENKPYGLTLCLFKKEEQKKLKRAAEAFANMLVELIDFLRTKQSYYYGRRKFK